MRTDTAGPTHVPDSADRGAHDPAGVQQQGVQQQGVQQQGVQQQGVETHGVAERHTSAPTGTAERGDGQERAGPPRAPWRRRLLVVAVWPYHSVRAWILRRRKVIDLRDRGRNAAVGLGPTPPPAASVATPPDDPSGRAGSGAAPD